MTKTATEIRDLVSFPELSGSTAQISWATEIREKRIAQALQVIDPSPLHGNPLRSAANALVTLRYLASQDSAPAWIENRNASNLASLAMGFAGKTARDFRADRKAAEAELAQGMPRA